MKQLRNILNKPTAIHNHLFFVEIFRYSFLANKINQPHNRSILWNSTELNSRKINNKVISEF